MPPRPAPGSHPIPLGSGWTAVLLQLLPGGPVAAVGLFHQGHLETVTDEPDEVRRLARELQRPRRASSLAR